MKKDVLLYTLSTALSRGSLIVFFPLASNILSIGEFGLWSLTLVCSSLLIPIVSLNGSAAILREGSENIRYTYSLTIFYTCISIFISLILYLISSLFNTSLWFKFSVVIALLESVIFLYSTALRVFERAWSFFIVNLTKTLLVLVSLLFSKVKSFGLIQLLQYQSLALLISLSIIIPYGFYYFYKDFPTKYSNTPLNIFRSSLIFSVALIPHGISQWLISSSDRFILQKLSNQIELGQYSLAYSLALSLGLINTAIGLTLPVVMIKNYESWVSKENDNIYIYWYTIIAILIFTIVIILYLLDWNMFGILNHYSFKIILLFYILYNSIFLLGIYYFFVNYLFYYKKSKYISTTTFLIAVINIILTTIFVYFADALGAAFATLISYTFYLIVISKLAKHVEYRVKVKFMKPCLAFFAYSSILTLGVFYIV